MENRKRSSTKSSPLPIDYIKLVNEVFTTNFADGLLALAPICLGVPSFDASGRIFADEIVLCVSLMQKGQLAATSVYASCDFDPRANTPSIQEVLALCVDAAGTVYSTLLDPTTPSTLAGVADQSLSAMENIPFEWTELEVNRQRVYVKADKANPRLDQLAEEWLARNDPGYQERMAEEQRETEKLFFTGPRKGSEGDTSH